MLGNNHILLNLRKFGLILTGYFVFFSLLLSIVKHRPVVSISSCMLFLIFFVSTQVWPLLLSPLKWLWDKLLAILHKVNTTILLGLIFFAIFSRSNGKRWFFVRVCGSNARKFRR